jgi:DNA-binding NarL/FixJ family response regulator
VLEAFRLAAVGSRDDIRETAARAHGTPKSLLKAILAQYEGDVGSAVSNLRHQLKVAKEAERVYIADMLAPILVMRHENDDVRRLSQTIAEAGWIASAEAFRALSAADEGNRHAARRHFAAALAALEDEHDVIVRFRVQQRLARAAFYLHEYEKALDLALSSASLAAAHDAWRAAAAGYSIAYNIHNEVTGDAAEADRFASLWRIAATKSNDASFVQSALVAEFGLAASFADDQRIATLERLIASRLLPQQYNERFSLAYSHALVRGATDLVAMQTLLRVLRDTPNRSRGEWSLCTALIAVADASVADDDGARRNLREAVTHLGRPSSVEPACEQHYRRLARAAVAAACVILGDDVRADRTVAAYEARQGESVQRFPALIRASKWDEMSPSLRGLARVVRAALEQRRQESAPAGLTRAELEVLRLLGNGWSAGKIAIATERSVNTVYNHTRSILSKLEASRAGEAVAIARDRGLLS